MKLTNTTKKAIIGLAMVGMAFAVGGCGDNATTLKPKSDLERYDAANKDLDANCQKIKEFDVKKVQEYIDKDANKYTILKFLKPDLANNKFNTTREKLHTLADYNATHENDVRYEKIYSKTEAEAGIEALDNIINSEERKAIINKIHEDKDTMEEIANKAQNNQTNNLQIKYKDDIMDANKIESTDYIFLDAERYFKNMIKNPKKNFWKE